MNILGTGLSGLVGSRIVELLTPKYPFVDLSLETGVDITDKSQVFSRIEQSDAPWIFHFAARTDVDSAEGEKYLKEQSPTWITNVTATEYIVNACRQFDKRLLYISTDYVFAGDKLTYMEEDEPNPIGWYAITKYEGEQRVRELREKSLIIRIANPYRAINSGKPDFVHKIINKLQKHEQIIAPGDQIFVPTFIDDIALAIDILLQNVTSGIFHVVGSSALSPYEAGKTIAKVFDLDESLVTSTTFNQYFKNRAPRPFQVILRNDRISRLGAHMSTFEEGLTIMKQQLTINN